MNINLGEYNTLKVVKEVDFGMYLDGGDDGEILLPSRYVPEGCKPGDELEVFIYLDIEERLVATTLRPLVKVGEFACLEVAWTNEYGAFLNWGLMKDLFVPFREQKARMQQGRHYVVYCYLDEESYRIAASAKVEKHLSKEKPTYSKGEKVNALVWQKTDLGYKVIIDNKYSGLLYKNELFQHIEPGYRLDAYIKMVREDGKLDISLQPLGYTHIEDSSEQLLEYIRQHDGFTPFCDKSAADDIYAEFSISKKTFKKAIGDLYKRHLITIEEDGLHLCH